MTAAIYPLTFSDHLLIIVTGTAKAPSVSFNGGPPVLGVAGPDSNGAWGFSYGSRPMQAMSGCASRSTAQSMLASCTGRRRSSLPQHPSGGARPGGRPHDCRGAGGFEQNGLRSGTARSAHLFYLRVFAKCETA